MYTVFVTGPLASGKRTACLYLAQHGFLPIDLDVMAREFLSDELVREQLVKAYGSGIQDDRGEIDKAILAERAFMNEESTAALNSIIWPLVCARLSDLIIGKSCQHDQTGEKLVVEVAMLAEASDYLPLADTVLCITADESIRIKRAVARGMCYDDVVRRVALQATDEKRASICDVIIENNSTIDSLHEKLDSWLFMQQQEHLF